MRGRGLLAEYGSPAGKPRGPSHERSASRDTINAPAVTGDKYRTVWRSDHAIGVLDADVGEFPFGVSRQMARGPPD